MTDNFADRLAETIIGRQSQVCVGLDPRLDRLPPSLIEQRPKTKGSTCGNRDVAAIFEEFCSSIIDAVAPHVAAVKLQLACFEQYGPAGMRVFKHLCRHASDNGLQVIADAKRGDIGVSAEAYSAAYIGRPDGLEGKLAGFGADAMTVNPLFGSDAIVPFLDDCKRYGNGIFVLVKTSNPGGSELQELTTGAGESLSERVASLIAGWGRDMVGDEGYSSIGAVVGATRGDAIGKLRSLMPESFFLLPGYGAQGATVRDVAPAFDSRGLGALVAASRSIIYAGSGEDYAASAASAAQRMRRELWLASTGK